MKKPAMRILEPFLQTEDTQVTIGGWDYLKRSLEKNLKDSKAYYNRTVKHVRNGHVLSKIINSSSVNLELDNARYYHQIQRLEPVLCRAMGLVSSYNQGGLSQAVFFDGCYEILMLDDADFNYDLAYKHWRELEPVQVLRHPDNDLNYRIPVATPGLWVDDYRVAVLKINIKMLLIQYKAWMAWQRGFDQPYNVNAFVHMFPLANAIRSRMEVALINRWCYPLEKEAFKTPFKLPNYDNVLDRYREQHMLGLMKKPLTIQKFYKALPAITKPSAFHVLSIRSLNASQQNRWAWFMAKAPYLAMAVQFNDNRKIQNPDTTKWPRDLKLLLNEFSVGGNDRIFESIYKKEINGLLKSI